LFTNNSPFDFEFPEMTFGLEFSREIEDVVKIAQNVVIPKGKTVAIKVDKSFSFPSTQDGEVFIKLSVEAKDKNQLIPLFDTKYKGGVNFLFQDFKEDDEDAKEVAQKLNEINHISQIVQIESSILSDLASSRYYLKENEKYKSIINIDNEAHKKLVIEFISSPKISYKIENERHLKNFDEVLYGDGFLNLKKIQTALKLYGFMLNRPYDFDKEEVEDSQFFIYILLLTRGLMEEQYAILGGYSKLFKSIKKEIDTNYPEFGGLVEDKEEFELAKGVVEDIVESSQMDEKEIYEVLINDAISMLNEYHEYEYKEMIFNLVFAYLVGDKVVTQAEKEYIRYLVDALKIKGFKEKNGYIYEDGDTDLGFNAVAKTKRFFGKLFKKDT